jgi:hypothetical protein
MVSAIAPTVIGYFSTRFGVGGALSITAVAFVLGGFSIFLIPETRGRQLT